MNSRTAEAGHAQPSVKPTVLPASRLSLQKRCACGGDGALTGECESCASKKLTMQRRSDGTHSSGSIPASVGQTLSSPGKPLDSPVRGFMESRFGHDFSSVRVHDDRQAAQSARDVRAFAYTVGQDIVFAPGQYQPDTESGQHLLAHELAHTIQQRGLHRSGTSDLADQGPEYRRLEADADAAANAAMTGTRFDSWRLASKPTLSRTPAVPATGTLGRRAKNITVTTAYMTTTHSVRPVSGFERGGESIQAFTVDKLFVPATKGPRALPIYQAAAGGALQATLSVDDGVRSTQWQQRDDTSGLQARWLQVVGWQAGADANTRWQAVGGDATFPRVNSATCQMDHIIELQISGNNSNDNIQALDAEQNRDSGGAIKNQVFGLAAQIQADRQLTDGTAVQLQLRFSGVELAATRGRSTPEAVPTTTPPNPRTCLSVESRARLAGTAPTTTEGSAPLEDYKITAGGAPTNLRVPTGFASTRTAPPVNIAGNGVNQSASELISGLTLNQLQHAARGNDIITAGLDTRDRTRLPLTLTGDTGGIDFNVGAPAAAGARPLTLRNPRPNVAFTYPYLSPGRLTQISLNPQGGTSWRGEINSNVPFLPRPLLVVYDNDSLRLAVELDRSHLRSPIPGFTLTDARLELSLAPRLSANGHLGFAIGTGANAIATGTVDLTADANGFVGTGQIRAHIPGVDEASGTLTYRDGVLSGQIVIESTQIRLPNVQRGRLQLDIDADGLHPSGELQMLLPRNLGDATLGFSREGSHFVYTGSGTLRVPGLHEVTINARYDGETFRATANDVGFRWHGLDGSINVTYLAQRESPGRITGTGRLTLARGDVHGTVNVTLHDSGRFSGHGQVTYPFNIRGQRLEATAGIIVQEDQSVRVEGALRFPQPIQLFRRFGDERQLFHFQRSIPIPGLSIGLVGVVAVVEGGVSAHYSFGPGELRNVALEAAFNPLAEHIDPNVAFHCELHIPAQAGIAGTIGGGLGVEAGLGRVNGTLTVTADLGLNAQLGGPLDLRYENRRFALEARPGIDASLNLGLSLDAHARAEAGVGPFTVGVEKSWNLGRRAVVLGQFSMHAPIAWSSDGSFTAPSLDQIEWGPVPEIDPASLLAQLFNASSAQERTS